MTAVNEQKSPNWDSRVNVRFLGRKDWPFRESWPCYYGGGVLYEIILFDGSRTIARVDGSREFYAEGLEWQACRSGQNGPDSYHVVAWRSLDENQLTVFNCFNHGQLQPFRDVYGPGPCDLCDQESAERGMYIAHRSADGVIDFPIEAWHLCPRCHNRLIAGTLSEWDNFRLLDATRESIRKL